MLDTVSKVAPKISVLNPTGYPPKVTKKSAADRLPTLDGKTIYLVDCRFDDSIELLKQVQAWFTDRMPSVKTKIVSLSNYYGHDDPKLWEDIKANADAAILGVGHCSTCAPAVTTHAIMVDTKYGVPAVSIHTHIFDRVVRSTAKVQGLASMPAIFVPQPVMGKSAEELRAYIDGKDPVTGVPVMQEIIEGLTKGLAGDSTKETDRSVPRLVPPDTEENLHKLFLENHWTDNLPIVLPTEERVAAMLAATSHPADKVVGRMQMTANRGWWECTVEKVAVNAVMAGCNPEYFPVVLALASSELSARSSSSSSAATMTIVNGPIRNEIKMNSGIGAMGPYNHANATIGRAYGLVSQNTQGGSVAGETYMGSIGNGYCYNNLTFAENEERSPWEPLHVQKGFKPTDSTVSIFWGCRSATFNLGLREKHWREHVRDMLIGTDAQARPCLLLDPITAQQFIDRGGFVKKAELIKWVHETAQRPAGEYWDLQLIQNYIYPRATYGEEPFAGNLAQPADKMINIFPLGDINVVVVGGGTNGYWQIMGATYRKTVSVDAWR